MKEKVGLNANSLITHSRKLFLHGEMNIAQLLFCFWKDLGFYRFERNIFS